MFILRKPMMLNFNGSTIQRDCCLLMSDFLYNKTSDDDIDLDDVSMEYSEVLPILKQYFGIDPFRDITNFYCNNDTKTIEELHNDILIQLAEIRPAYEYLYTATGNKNFSGYQTVDGLSMSNPWSRTLPGHITAQLDMASLFTGYDLNINNSTHTVTLSVCVLPEQYYQNGSIIIPETGNIRDHVIQVSLHWKTTNLKFDHIQIYRQSSYFGEYRSILTAMRDSTIDDLVAEGLDNPYEIFDGDSGTGGGDGAGSGADIDGIDPALLPDLPNISAITSGLMTVYMPTALQLSLLGDFLWSSGFDIADLKKLFADPMSALIGLSILPVSPSSAGSKSVKFGDVDTGVSMPYTNNQFVRVSCGSVRIDEYVGCFMDYAPYVNIQIYLPGIGIRDLSPDDCMNETLTLTYHIDVITGGCAAFIQCGSKGILYQFNGSLIANVPLTANNYSGAIQNAVSAVLSGAGVIAGAVTGAAPLTAMGAVGLAQSAANTALNAKPQIERSGNMGGSAGILSIQKPYIIINRPNMSVPRNINKFVGNCLNVTMKLKNCSGFTMVQFINLNYVTCTDDEKQELMKLLNEGVIL